jgi:hypothetical protein
MEKFPVLSSEKKEVPVQYPEIASEIEQMAKLDQEMRHEWIKGNFERGSEIDREHTAKMHKIVDKIGWPTFSKVGERPSHDAWLLVQHAIHDIPFMQKCFELMNAEPESETNAADKAMLYDRLQVLQGRPQKYGTQFERDENGNQVVKPIENLELANELRRSVGLQTIEEDLAEMKKLRESAKEDNS